MAMDQTTVEEYWEVFLAYVGAVMDPDQDQQKFYDNITEDERAAIGAMAANAELVKKAKSELAAPPPAPTLAEVPDEDAEEEEPAEPELGEVDEESEGKEEEDEEVTLPYLPTDLEGQSPRQMDYEEYYNLVRGITFGLADLLHANVSNPTLERVAANAASTSYKWDTVEIHGLRVYIARGIDPQGGEQALYDLMNSRDDEIDENEEEDRRLTEAYKKALGRRISSEAYQAGLFQVLSGVDVDTVVEWVESGRFGDPDDTHQLGDIAHDGNGGSATPATSST